MQPVYFALFANSRKVHLAGMGGINASFEVIPLYGNYL